MPRARRQPQPGLPTRCRRNHVPLVRTRPHAAAVRHGPAHCRRKREGATQFPTIGLFERTRTNFKGTRNTKAQKSWSSRAEPEVRIHLPPADSLGLARPGRYRPKKPRFRAGGRRCGRQRHEVLVEMAHTGSVISVGRYSSTAVPPMSSGNRGPSLGSWGQPLRQSQTGRVARARPAADGSGRAACLP